MSATEAITRNPQKLRNTRRITSRTSTIDIGVTFTDELIQGTIAVPHGWGHSGSWQRAKAAGGSTSNFLADEVEALSATTVLNAIPVRVEPVAWPNPAQIVEGRPA